MANLNLPFGIRVSSNDPLDAERYIAVDQTAMDTLITAGRAYEGLQVYNESDKTVYFLEVLGVDPGSSAWTPLTGGVDSGTIIPPNMVRVTKFGGNDLTGQIGNYTKPFETVTAAVDACRQAIVADNTLVDKLVVNVELGDYIDEKNLVFAGTLKLNDAVNITGEDGFTTFDVTDTAFSGLQQQRFFIQGLGASLHNVTFDHPDQTQRHTLILKLDYLQWKSAVIASEFILDVDYVEVTNNGNLYFVDSVDIHIDRMHVSASVDVIPFILNPADIPGTIDNSSSIIFVNDAEVEPTGRLSLTKFLDDPNVPFEKHIINITLLSGYGDIVIVAESAPFGDLVLNYIYNIQHANAIDSNSSSTRFLAFGNTVLNVKANITNNSYLQRGLLIESHENSIVYADITLTSFSSKKHLYLGVFDSGQLTLNATVDVMSSNAGTSAGIYFYAPNEAPYDDVTNNADLYFENVIVRKRIEEKGGFALQSWVGAKHLIQILGSYSVVGNWSLPIQGGAVELKHLATIPVSAEVTRDLIIATAGQLVFPSMYKLVADQLQVIMNGVVLGGDDYSITATDLTLGLAAFEDDEITLISSDALPNVYEMTEWAQTSPVSADSVVLSPITFITAPTNPLVNGVLTGPDLLGDGVLYNNLPFPEDPATYLSYNIVQDSGKTVQLISVRFSARVQNAGDSSVIVKVQASNDSFVSNWESPEYIFTTESYVTKEWYLNSRLFSPDKNSSTGIQIRVFIYTSAANIGQGIYFNNFILKGYHKLT